MDDVLAQINKTMNETGVSAAIVARNLPIDEVHPDPEQPRTDKDTEAFEEGIKELAESIRVHGVLEPILVTKEGDSGYRIIAGERRWLAAKAAGLAQIPSIIRDTMAEDQRFIVQVVENIQREDMTPRDTGEAIRRLLNMGFAKQDVAAQFGKSPSFVTRMLSYAEAFKDPRTARLVECTTPQTWLLLSTKDPEVQDLAYDIAKSESGADGVKIFRKHIDDALARIVTQADDLALGSDPISDDKLEMIQNDTDDEFSYTLPEVQPQTPPPPPPSPEEDERSVFEGAPSLPEIKLDAIGINTSDTEDQESFASGDEYPDLDHLDFADTATSDQSKELNLQTRDSVKVSSSMASDWDNSLKTKDSFLLFSKPVYVTSEALHLLLKGEYDEGDSEIVKIAKVKALLASIGIKEP